MLHGDEEAFSLVYRDVQPRLLRYLTTLVGTPDADGIAAETWTQATRDLTGFAGRADGFRAWITRIGRRRALEHLEARGRRPVLDSTYPEPSAGEADPYDALRLIGSLPPDQAEAVLLRSVMGLDAGSASSILDRRSRSVRRAATRGLRALARRGPDLPAYGGAGPEEAGP